MRPTLFSLALVAIASTANAQVGIDDRIAAAYQKLSLENSLYIVIEGSESTDSVTHKFVSHLYWNYDTTGTLPMAKIQVVAFEDEVLTHRMVGTGDVLYDYDVANRQYSATNYGGFGTARSNRYVRDLLYNIDKFAKGQEQYGARLLREIYAEATPAYKSWMPGIAGSTIPNGGLRDPFINTRVYVPTPTISFLQYRTPKRTVTFELQDDPPSDIYKLASMYFSEQVPQGNRVRTTEWHMTPYKGLVFDATNFEPFSYDVTRRWKIVTGPQPFKG